jgi:hypothetical protein
MFGPPLRRWVVLVLLGVVLFVNPVWLLPQEGEPRYTYERVRLVPADDDIEYQRDVDWFVGGHHNDLRAVGCEGFVESTGSRRLCAFEQSVADDGPVTVHGDLYAASSGGPQFVDLRTGYYRRVVHENGSKVTLDLQPVDAETVLAAVASNRTGISPERLSDDLATRALATGEPVVTRRAPESVRAGEVFRYEGAYYTVVLTDRGVVDWPILSAGVRAFLQLVGVLLSFLGIVLLLGAWLDAR